MTAGGWSVPVPTGPVEWQPELDIPEPGRQRRLTVLLRLLLLIPQFVAVTVLAVVATVAAVIGWFAALLAGHLPSPVARFLAGYVGYHARVTASTMLLVDRYPPFALYPPADYPVQIELHPGRLNRWAVLFRWLLMIPAVAVNGVVGSGWFALSVLIWLVVLIAGRMPRPLFEASAATMRYGMRLNAYVLMLTSAYPKGLFGDGPPVAAEPAADGTQAGAERRSATRPLLLSGLGTAVLVLFIVVGLAAHVASDVNMNGNGGTSVAPPGEVTAVLNR